MSCPFDGVTVCWRRRWDRVDIRKGEASNALARAVFFHRLGELRGRTFVNRICRAVGLNLLVAAIILRNTRHLDDALGALEREGRSISPVLIASIAPLGQEDISMTGDCIWPEAPVTGPVRFDRSRPCRRHEFR